MPKDPIFRNVAQDPRGRYNTRFNASRLEDLRRPRSPTPARIHGPNRRRPTPYPEQRPITASQAIGTPVAGRVLPYTRERQLSIISISSDSSAGTEAQDAEPSGQGETPDVTDRQAGRNVDVKDADNVKDEESGDISEGPRSLLAAIKEHVHCGICCELLWDPYIMYVHSF
ncbi:hypothetical protein V5O48_006489 [Marasmius crinis-equi]|uniref:Uncharacterized protein n=1 Tax=Marasmius crinis-equi TaxID=585013 RepID=A0ABR3FJC1_9AGAR